MRKGFFKKNMGIGRASQRKNHKYISPMTNIDGHRSRMNSYSADAHNYSHYIEP